MEDEKVNIELRSEEVQEILGHIPSRIIRYGITVFFAVIALLFVAGFFFRYPDILSAPAEVVTQNPPAPMVARIGGNIANLFVADSQWVEAGTVLAVIQNPANWGDMLYLQNISDSLENAAWSDTLWLQQLSGNRALGDVQPAYSSLVKQWNDYRVFLQMQVSQRKISALQKKEAELKKYAEITQRQAALKQQEHQLARNAFARDSQLYLQNIIALADYENSRKSLIQSGLSVESALSSVVNTNMQQQEIAQQIIDVQMELEQRNTNYLLQLDESFNNLKSTMRQWFNTYVLQTPVSGIVAFSQVWGKNQFVQAGGQVMTVIPGEKSSIMGRVKLPVLGAGKVKPGQRVNVKFNNYPYQEFGMITATVSSISLVPAEEAYVVELNMPDTLITNYGRLLPFSQNMPAVAEIVTEDLPLIVRLFNPLKAILLKNTGYQQEYKPAQQDETDVDQSQDVVRNDEIQTPLEENSSETVTALEKPSEKRTTDKNESKPWHIIASSFSTKEKAILECNKLLAEGYQAQILSQNGRIRVSLFQYPDKESALEKLNQLRNTNQWKACWLLKN